VWRHRDLSLEQALAGDGRILAATLNEIPADVADPEPGLFAHAGIEKDSLGVPGITAEEEREPETLVGYQVLPEDIQALTPLGPQERTTLRIRYRAREAGKLQATWSVTSGGQVFEAESQASFRRTNPGGPAYVDVALAGLPDEARLTGLEVQAPQSSGFRPRSASLVQTPDWLTLLQPDQKRDDFDLRALPWVWGELDPLAAVERTEPVHVLQKDVVTLAATESLEWAMPPTFDAKQAGYLHLRLAPLCPTEGKPDSLIKVRYGPSLESAFRFRPITLGLEEGQVFPLPLAHEATLRDMVALETGYGPAFSATGPDPFFHQARNPISEGSGFSASGTGNNKDRPLSCCYGIVLGRIQHFSVGDTELLILESIRRFL
jgi:hypothetical protein